MSKVYLKEIIAFIIEDKVTIYVKTGKLSIISSMKWVQVETSLPNATLS